MNTQEFLPLLDALGWALLHFVWQGAAIGLVLVVVRRCLDGRSPNARYVTACGALLSMAIAPIITMQVLWRTGEHDVLDGSGVLAVRAHEMVSEVNRFGSMEGMSVHVQSERNHAGNFSFESQIKAGLPWVVGVWFGAVVLLWLRLLAGWIEIRRVRLSARELSGAFWEENLARTVRKLNVGRSIRLLESAWAEAPMMVGWLRPVILFPATSLSGLTPEQLETILAHEIAHIRRHDYLVNLLQSVVETLLFYHPAVWWVSGQIRQEREHCCDDLTVRVCGDRMAYARALATLEALRCGPVQWGLAASSRPLLGRIRRLMGRPPEPDRSAWWIAGVLGVMLLMLGSGWMRDSSLMAAEPRANAGASASRADESTSSASSQGEALPGPSPVAKTNIVHTSKGRERIRQQLDSIILEEVLYDDLTLSEVVKRLSEEARRRDPDKRGINIILNPLAPTPSSKPMDLSQVTVRINPPLRNVRLAEVIDAVCKVASVPLKYSVEDYAVVISQPGPPELFTRTFKVDPRSFLEGLESVVPQFLGSSDYRSRAGGDSRGSTQDLVRAFFTAAGIDFPTNPFVDAADVNPNDQLLADGKAPVFDDKKGTIIVPPNWAKKKALFYNDKIGIILARATLEELDLMEQALQVINSSPAQVLIEAKFAEISDEDAQALGLDWFLSGTNRAQLADANAAPAAMALLKLNPQVRDRLTNITYIVGTVSGILTDSQSRTVLKKLETRSGVDVLSSPKLTTLSGRSARIETAEEIEVVLFANRKVGDTPARLETVKVPVGTLIDVVPNVSSDKSSVQLDLTAQLLEFLGYERSAFEREIIEPKPHFRLRHVSGKLMIPNGHTLVLTGMRAEDSVKMSGRTPVLGELPMLGRFFRSESKARTSKQLVIFVTATIIDPAGNAIKPRQ